MAISTFTWLDHRDDDAERVREALAGFEEQGMVDPLGLGIVRDVFSETLFPGITTVQTRARYFLFVPWIYRSLDADGTEPGDGAKVAREREVALIEALIRGSDDQEEGIIGRHARESTRQLPSLVYWSGLGRWDIRRFDGTPYDYVASLAARRRRSQRSPDGGDEPAAEPTWHPGLPEPPDGLLEKTTIALTHDEATFLQGRVLDSVPHSYLALLVRDGSSKQTADMPWHHPLAATAPLDLQRRLDHARLFSLAMWGAGLVYNDELSNLLARDGGEGLSTDYRLKLGDWLNEMATHRDELKRWSRDEFWTVVSSENPNVPGGLQSFVNWWLDLAIEGPSDVVESSEVREGLHLREAELKGARAKLANRRAREVAPGAQADERMTFRWGRARNIIADIHRGLEGDAEPA